MNISPGDRIPTQTPGCQTERLGNETLVFCSAASETIYLNDTAALVWALCDGTRTVMQIVHLLRQAFPEAALRVAGDVEHALGQLRERGAIRFA